MTGPPYQKHLSSASDLVTSYEETRAGFIALALEKNMQATPFVTQAKHLREVASKASQPDDLIAMTEIRSAVLKASGLSDKAEKYFDEKDKEKAIMGLVEKFLRPAGSSFVDELVYRFLLTKGDTLGGMMRNIEGKWAQSKFTEILTAALDNAGFAHQVFPSSASHGLAEATDEVEMGQVKAISWRRGTRERTIIFNTKLRVVEKNVDAILYDAFPADHPDIRNQVDRRFLAFGELKGGIDPAGADEHWKTGSTALNRIRSAFSKLSPSPSTFFVASAIESAMAKEIWGQLTDGVLTNAANLNKISQMTSLANWVVLY